MASRELNEGEAPRIRASYVCLGLGVWLILFPIILATPPTKLGFYEIECAPHAPFSEAESLERGRTGQQDAGTAEE